MNIETMCSATVGVCGDGFRSKVFPARMAGTSEFIKIRYGYYNSSISYLPPRTFKMVIWINIH